MPMLAQPQDVTIVAASQPQVAAAARQAAAAVARVKGAPRRFAATDAPYLSGSPLGQRFLAAPSARALARGEPGDRCPSAGLGAGADVAEAAGAALGACLAALRGAPDCACRVLAADDVPLAPLSAFGYAPGVGGRLVGMGDGARPLTVEERPTADPMLTLVAFFDAAGPVAVAELDAGGGARLVMTADGALFQGAREPRGWRRGRLSERLLLTGASGEKLIALIGFEPADIAAEGSSLAAWPG